MVTPASYKRLAQRRLATPALIMTTSGWLRICFSQAITQTRSAYYLTDMRSRRRTSAQKRDRLLR